MAAPEAHLAKAERFLRTAALARSDGDHDSCVSRSAYAALHACIALLLADGASPEIAEASKQKIYAEFARLVNQRYSDMARLRGFANARNMQQSLERLNGTRNRADYEVPGVSARASAAAIEFTRLLVDGVRLRIGH